MPSSSPGRSGNRPPLVFAIVLNWNGLHLLEPCLRSLLSQTYGALRILLVDNASTDGSVEFVRKSFPQVDVMVNERNLLFARANNRGIRYALERGADYVILLNNDAVAAPDCLEELVSAAEADAWVGLCAPRVLMAHDDAFLNTTGLCFNLAGIAWDRGIGRADSKRWDSPAEVAGVSGVALFVRSSVFARVGLLDEGYPIYYEDLDFSCRTRAAGYKALYVPKARVYHAYSATLGQASPRKQYLSSQSRVRFLLKAFPVPRLVAVIPFWVYQELRWLAAWFRRGRYDMMCAEMLALLAAIWHLAGAVWARGSSQFSLDRVIEQWAEKDTRHPRIHEPVRDYPRATIASSDIRERIVMGECEDGLESGWYNLEGEGQRYRWTAGRASAYLRWASGGGRVVYVRACVPTGWPGQPRLRVFVEGQLIGEETCRAGCHEYRFPSPPHEGPRRCTLEVEPVLASPELGDMRDRGIMVMELGLSRA